MKNENTSMEINPNVKTLTDKKLLEQADYLIQEERKNTILILRHLREIELRRLFVDLKYSSMYNYCIKHLKYSEGQTQRRLSAARLLAELPEIEEKIESGSHNITNLAKVRSFLNTEKAANQTLDREEKIELLQHLEDQSTREVEKKLVNYSSQPERMAEKFHLSTSGKIFEAYLGPAQEALLEEFKNLYAHDLKDHADGTILNFLLEKAVQFKKKKLGITEEKNTAPMPSAPKATQKPAMNKNPGSKLNPQRIYITIAERRTVWNRAGSCCEHIDPISKTRCNSKFALQVDHVIAVALGGNSNLENLRLLCRAHNSRRSIKTFGQIYQ